VGRPQGPSARRTAAVEESLLDWVRAGKSTQSWCAANQWNESTIWRWSGEEPFGQAFARARAIGALAMIYQCLDIADDTLRDVNVTDDGREVPNSEFINRSRLRVDTRMKLAEKFNPALLGARTALTGHADAPPVVAAPPNDLAAVNAITRIFAVAQARKDAAEAAAAEAEE
jgi:hypothetical protein